MQDTIQKTVNDIPYIEVSETIEVPAGMPVPEPPNNNLRDAGIVVGVIVAALACAKLYKCTCKKK